MTTKAITPLRQRMIEDMNARKLCAGTQRGHILACKRFAAFLKRSPDTALRDDIRGFQLHCRTRCSACYDNGGGCVPGVTMREYPCRNVGCFPAESLPAGRSPPAISLMYRIVRILKKADRRGPGQQLVQQRESLGPEFTNEPVDTR